MLHRPDGSSIELDQDMGHSALFWRIERIAWVIMTLIVLAAVIGVFGGAGLLRSKQVAAGDLQVEYDVFGRHKAPVEYRLSLANVGAGDRPRLFLSNGFLSGLEISSITPQPRSAARDAEWTELVFERPPGDELHVTLQGTNQSIGLHSGEVRGPGDEVVRIKQFTYP